MSQELDRPSSGGGLVGSRPPPRRRRGRQVDDEAVVAETLLRRARLELLRLMLRAANWPRMPWRFPGRRRPGSRRCSASAPWAVIEEGATATNRSGCRCGPRCPLPGWRGRRALQRAGGRSLRYPARVLASRRAASAVEFAAIVSAPGSSLASSGGTGRAHGERQHPADLVQLVHECHQVEVDVEDHFSLDEQVEVEDQRVERGIDRALDGVLDRTKPMSTCPFWTASSTSRSGSSAPTPPRRSPPGSGALFGEGAAGPKKATDVAGLLTPGQDSERNG